MRATWSRVHARTMYAPTAFYPATGARFISLMQVYRSPVGLGIDCALLKDTGVYITPMRDLPAHRWSQACIYMFLLHRPGIFSYLNASTG